MNEIFTTAALRQRTVSGPVRTAIIGFGKVGQTRARCIEASPLMELVAVADVTATPPAPLNARYTIDIHEILSDPSVEAIVVSTFNNVAPNMVVAALEAGKHVFCEKPPGRTVADIEHIRVAEAANPELKLQFGFNHRYHYAVMEARSIVESGHLGRVLWMRGVYGKSGDNEFNGIWRNDPAISGGGILLDQGIHMLDLFSMFCGDFQSIRSLVKTMYWDIPVEDNAFAILENKTGQVAFLHSSATHWKHRFTLEICLEQGYLNLNGILSSTRSYGDESLTFARKDVTPGRTIGRPREEIIYFDKDDSWSLELNDFAGAIQEGTPVRSGTSTDALRAMRLVFDIYGGGSLSG